MIWAEDRSALELEKATRRSTSVVAADHAAQKRLRLRADVVHADQAHVAGVVRRAARRAREAPMCEANPACVWNENEECGNA